MLDIKNRCIIINNNKYDFVDVKYINDLNYYIDYDDFGDRISFVDISFILSNNISETSIKIQFVKVSSLKIKDFGGSYNQIMGFNIVDSKDNGWESDSRYHIEDYENGIIDFYCSQIYAI
jgi:hypothetical protein